MMKKLKYLTSLFALAVVGTGFLSSDAEAAVINSVTIVTPADSGAVRGIDSLVCVRVSATFTSDPGTSEAFVWLFKGDNVTTPLDQVGGVTPTPGATGAIRAAGVEQGTPIADPDDFVAASGSIAVPAALPPIPAVADGDVPATGAVTTTITGTSTRTVLYTIYIKIPANAESTNLLRVAASVRDLSRTAGQQWSAIVASPASKRIRVDAERPDQTGFAGFLNGPFPATGDVQTVAGEAVLVKGVTGGGLGDANVLNIGDKILIQYDLGNRGDDVILQKTLRLVARFLGKTIELPVSTRFGTFTYTIKEGDFANLSLQTLGEFTFSLFLIDQAGNLSDADPNEPNPEGVSQAVTFLVDSTKPTVDTTEGDTLALANGDTLTCGMINGFADSYTLASDAPDWLVRQDLNALAYNFAEGLDKLKIDFAGPKNLSVTIDPVDAHFNAGPLGTSGDFSLNPFAMDAHGTIDFSNLGKALTSEVASTAAVVSAADEVLDLGFGDPDAADNLKTGAPQFTAFLDQKVNMNGVLTDQVLVTGDNAKDGLMDGIYSVSFTPTDLAGNAGATKTYTNICIDVTKPSFGARLFPMGSALETINEETARVRFQFNEPMAHAEIVFIPIDGSGAPTGGTTRRRVLAGSELTSTAEQLVPVDSLQDGVRYRVFIVAQDLKGKINQSTVDEFLYDVEFINPVADRFLVTTDFSTDPAATVPAGTAIQLTIKAQDAVDDLGVARDPVLDAVTYDEDGVIVRIERPDGDDSDPDEGIKLIADKNPGVTPVEGQPGVFVLDRNGWANGERNLFFTDESANDQWVIIVVGPDEDNPDATINGFVADVDGAQRIFKVVPGIYSQLVLAGPESALQGEAFWVDVHASDKFGNIRLADSRFVVITSNKIGVIGPTGGEIMLSEGVGGFWAKSPMWHGEGLIFKARDILPFEVDPDGNRVLGTAGNTALAAGDKGGHFIFGSSPEITILPADGTTGGPLTSVAEVIVLDYAGANNLGDQGGFVTVNFPITPEHGSLDSYTIWREVVTTVIVGEDGSLQVLDPADAVTVFIPWAVIPAHTGVDLMRVVVATLDSDASRYAVTANGHGTSTIFNEDDEGTEETEGDSTEVTEGDSTEVTEGDSTVVAKRAFADAAAIASPYELMAQTMVNSKEAVAALKDVPVFATLTPEALAFMDNGIVPSLKEVGNAFQSAKTISPEAVRAIDNIAPEAIASLRVADTPNDAGSSITVNWAKSASDAPITLTVANAVGASGNTYNTRGVMGYNIYRALGNDGEFQLVGKANAGETSFTDVTALNGVRYSYKVIPYDNDNEATSDLAGSAMAIRNRVLDRNGQVVVGLFGADNKVGFDDFFIFADHFGLKAGEMYFEAAFDLNQDNQINFTDFFTFADNFGRSVDLAGKAVPTLAGLNTDARLDLATGDALPRVGEDMIVRVNLGDFMEVKGYGFHMSFDSDQLEFVEVAPVDNNILGESDLAHPQVMAQEDGELSIAAYGDVATEGQLEVDLVFRAKTEIEDGYIELSEGALRDGNFGLNQVSSLGFVRIETRPEAFALGNNFPNPFNPETTIKYALPEAGSTKLVIYNVVGQVVRHLVAEHQSAGRYVIQWDATNDNGQPLSSGVYFYHLQVGKEFQQVKRMLLLK